MARRPKLDLDRIVEASVTVADRGGLAEVSMRHVGAELGVEAMSLYHHVAGKEALLDALADWYFTQIELPVVGAPWRAAMVGRAVSARDVLTEHPWALGLVESRRTPMPALLRHHDAVLGCLRGDGFTVALAAHAFSAIDAYVYGFVLTELNLPMEVGEDTEAFVAQLEASIALDDYPHLLEMITEQVKGRGYAYGDEFLFGLDLVLDSVDRHRRRRSPRAK